MLAVNDSRSAAALYKEQQRTLKALGEARENLRDAHLKGARANRFSGRPGRRFDSLDALAKAAAIRPSADLRDEIIASLTLPDVRLTKTIPRGFEQQRSAIFDEALDRYATDTEDKGISIRRVSDDRELDRLEGEGTGSEVVRFSHNGRLLVTRQNDGPAGSGMLNAVRILLTGRTVGTASASCVAFSPDDRAIAMVEGNSEVVIHDLAHPGKPRTLPVQFAPHLVQFNPSGQRLVVASDVSDDALVLDAGSGKVLAVLPHDDHVWYVAWDPSGARLGCITASLRSVYLWDVATRQDCPRSSIRDKLPLSRSILQATSWRARAGTVRSFGTPPAASACSVGSGRRGSCNSQPTVGFLGGGLVPLARCKWLNLPLGRRRVSWARRKMTTPPSQRPSVPTVPCWFGLWATG